MSKNISETSNALPLAGSVTSTTTAAALPALDHAHALREIILQAHPDNDDNILIGNSGAQGWVLEAGEEMGIPVGNPAEVFHRAATGTQVLGYLGRD